MTERIRFMEMQYACWLLSSSAQKYLNEKKIDLLNIVINSASFKTRITIDELALRRVLLGKKEPSEIEKKFLTHLIEENTLARGLTNSSSDKDILTKLPQLIAGFLSKYPEIGRYVPGIENVDITKVNNQVIETKQQESRRTLNTHLTGKLSSFNIVDIFKGSKRFLQIWKAQFKVNGLLWKESFEENKIVWQEFLSVTPVYSEIALALLYFSDVNPEIYLDKTTIANIEIEDEKFVVETSQGTQYLPIVQQKGVSLSLMFHLLCLEKRLINHIQKEAIGYIYNQFETDKIMSTTKTKWYSPSCGTYLNDNFLKIIPKEKVDLLKQVKSKRVIIICEYDLILFFTEKFEFITCTSYKQKKYQKKFLKLFKSYFNEAKMSYKDSVLFTRKDELREGRNKKGLMHLPLLSYFNKKRISSIVANKQKPLRMQLTQFQQRGNNEILDEILENASFQKTVEILAGKAGIEDLQDFFVKNQNISPGMIAFLSLLDCEELTSQDITGMNLFDHIRFNRNGVSVKVVGNDKNPLSKNVLLPYSDAIKPYLFSIQLRAINIDQYIVQLFRHIGEALFNYVDPVCSEYSDFNKTIFYSLNSRNFIRQDELNTMVDKLERKLPNQWLKNNKIIYLTYTMNEVFFFSENFFELGSIVYNTEFTQTVLASQQPIASEVLNKSSQVSQWIKKWIFSVDYKTRLTEKFLGSEIFKHLDNNIEQLNVELVKKNYPFRFLTKDDVFVREEKPGSSTTFLTDEEVSIIFPVFSWFPRGMFRKKLSFPGIKYIAKQVLNRDPARNIGDVFFPGNEDKFRYFRSEIRNRIRKDSHESGIAYNKKTRVMKFDDIYFLGYSQNDDNAIRAILKNLLDWIADMRAEEIGLTGKLENRKQFIKDMVQYINARLGQLPLKHIEAEVQERFIHYDSIFLDNDELLTVPSDTLKSIQ